MENKTYLIFSLYGLHYGVDALLVQEIFYLPELTPIAEAPDDFVGLLNLRSKILPVMHLALRLGYQSPDCHLSDSVIVLKWEGTQIGIIVNQVHEVININLEVIESQALYGQVKKNDSRFIAVAKMDTGTIMLLNHENLFYYSDIDKTLILGTTNNQVEKVISNHEYKQNGKEIKNQSSENYRNFASKMISSFYFVCCPNATPEERVIFQERAGNLRRTAQNNDFTGLMPLAVVGLNDEYFGLDLDVVREFADIRNVTPIPCCPSHIIGNMNLRGEIVTLVDIRSVLNMPIANISSTSKAIVFHVDDLVVGLPVDEVFDVLYLRPSDMMPVPVAVNSGSDEYLRGIASYLEKMLSILDLPKILMKGGLTVNEEP